MHTSIIWSPPTNKEQWLEQREAFSQTPLGTVTAESIRFGGSSMSSIMGINPHEGKVALFKRCMPLIKGEPRPKQTMSEAMHLGTAYEPGGRVMTQTIYPHLEILRDETRVFGDSFIVTVDGLLAEVETGRIVAVLEIKTKYKATSGEIRQEIANWKGGVPAYYIPQLELYCRAYDLPQALLVIQTPANAPEYYAARKFDYPVPLDLVDRCATFCHYHRSDVVWEIMQQAEREFRECLRTDTRPKRGRDNAYERQRLLDEAYFTDLRSRGVLPDLSQTDSESEASEAELGSEEPASG